MACVEVCFPSHTSLSRAPFGSIQLDQKFIPRLIAWQVVPAIHSSAMGLHRAVGSGATGAAMAVPLFEKCTSTSDSLTHTSVLWYK